MDNAKVIAIVDARTAKLIETGFAPLQAKLARIVPHVEERIAALTARVARVADETDDDLDDEEDK